MVVPGRAFLRRLIDLTKGVKSARHFIRLNKGVKDDLILWQSFLQSFNVFYTDNAALVDIINKTTSRDLTIMHFVRKLGASLSSV